MQTELAKTFAEKTMLVDFSCRVLTGMTVDHDVTRRAIKSHNAQDDAGVFYKRLIPKALIRPIKNFSVVCRQWHYTQTCAWLDDGKRLLPAEQYFHYMDGMAERGIEFDGLVESFCSSYEKIIENNNYRLGDMYREGEMPSVSEIRRRFGFDIDVYPTPTAGDFRAEIAEEEIERVQHNLEIMANQAVEEIANDLHRRIYKAVYHLHERMVEYKVDPETGKTTNKLYDSTMGNIKELVELLPRLNVTGNTDLENLRQEIAAKIAGYDTETLKGSQVIRDEVRDSAKGILDKMRGYTG